MNEGNAKSTKEVSHALLWKLTSVLIITLLLLIPTTLIKSIIHERQATQDEAVHEISEKWGREQTISGPVLSIPFTYSEEIIGKDDVKKRIKHTRHISILPESLHIDGVINPQTLYRGIFEVAVYDSKLNLTGSFGPFELDTKFTQIDEILWDQATLSIGISDLRGIQNQIDVIFNDQTYNFNPGTPFIDKVTIPVGISANVHAKPVPSSKSLAPTSFNIEIQLKGSQRLYFIPTGKTTDVNIGSTWKSPSFGGNFLPLERNISNQGFNARWTITHLNRNFPHSWVSGGPALQNSSFGIDLYVPVSNYQKAERSIKYAILFIGLTFIVFFFVEIMNKKPVHPIQYILIGLGLCLFYTLLISISEHSSFNFAYGVSSIMTIGLVSMYTKAVLKNKNLLFMMSILLTTLYSFIFILIQLQDFSLLMGSLGLFLILSIIMYYSRRIDWYQINRALKIEYDS